MTLISGHYTANFKTTPKSPLGGGGGQDGYIGLKPSLSVNLGVFSPLLE